MTSGFVVALALATSLATSQAYAETAPPRPAPIGGQLSTGMMPPGAPDAAPSLSSSAVLPQVATPGYVLGTDVASYQHPGGLPIDWKAVKASGQSFTVIKATEETSYTNPYLLSDVAGARAAGLYVGVYHFARPELSTATAQADYFSRTINGIGGGLLPPVLDLEQSGGLSTPALVAWTSAFLGRVQQDTGRVPMIYTGPYFWSTAMGGSAAFARYRLWEAHYTTAAQPQVIPGWPGWSVWQYSNGTFGSPTAVPGIPARVDRDRISGTVAQLAALVSLSRPGVQAPFTGTATTSQFPDSTYVRISGDPHVYVIAGLAPLWVTKWANVGGPHPVRVISLATFRTLRSSPVEGTFLIDRVDGHAYRVIGGAPVIVTSWAPFPKPLHYVTVDDWDIVNAGACASYCHLSAMPRDGTIIRGAESNHVYVIAGGAPVYVSTWAAFGGKLPFIDINETSIDRAGLGTYWNHLSFVPSDGTVLSDSSTGALYQVTAGHPAPATPDVASSATPFTLVDDAAILNAGGTDVWAHLK